MSATEDLERVLERVTPTWLLETVREMAASSRVARESGVSLPDLIAALVQGADLGGGATLWRAQLRIKDAIAETAAMVPELCFIEADS